MIRNSSFVLSTSPRRFSSAANKPTPRRQAAGSAQIPEDAEMALGRRRPGWAGQTSPSRKRPQPGRETIISNRELPLGEAKGAKD
jgi:hypothetical protein